MGPNRILPIPVPPRAVLFDMDGVLVDTFDAWVAVLDACRRRRGMPPIGPEGVRASWGQGLLADCETIFPGEDPARLAAEYEASFAAHAHLVRAETGAVEAVRTARGAGAATAVVTNSPRGLAERIVAAAGMADGFDVVAGGDEVPKGKPDPDLVHLALARLRVAPDLCVFVGDTTLDEEAARAAGVPFVGYRLGRGARVDRLGDLAGLLGLVPRPR